MSSKEKQSQKPPVVHRAPFFQFLISSFCFLVSLFLALRHSIQKPAGSTLNTLEICSLITQILNRRQGVPETKGNHGQSKSLLQAFAVEFQPLETHERLLELTDSRTGARYCECHLKANKIVELGTIDVPLDPEEQPDYRANRDIVLNSSAFQTMKEDAKNKRSFSNIVAEYTKEFDIEHPLKIIGGQHRFEAIREALGVGVDEYYGVKVYLGLDITQRLDVQLISNTNITISGDLFDRLQETFQGPQLRDWSQKTGLLVSGQDFADSYERGGPISVKMARTFISNYFTGMTIDSKKFDLTDTTPVVCPTGGPDAEWERLKAENPKLWTNDQLLEAGKEFAALVKAQRESFKSTTRPKPRPDYPEKAMNMAVMSAWAYVAGMLHANPTRLKRHFDLRKRAGKDPLNAAALAAGRHKSDAENYRGLGYRTDPRERGRFVELFSLQAEDGGGIAPSSIDVAIKQYHAKQAQLEVLRARGKSGPN